MVDSKNKQLLVEKAQFNKTGDRQGDVSTGILVHTTPNERAVLQVLPVECYLDRIVCRNNRY